MLAMTKITVKHIALPTAYTYTFRSILRNVPRTHPVMKKSPNARALSLYILEKEKLTMSIPNYLYALANHKGHAIVNAGGMSIPVKIMDLEHESSIRESDRTTFKCLVVNDDLIKYPNGYIPKSILNSVYGANPKTAEYAAYAVTDAIATAKARAARRTVNQFDIKRVIFSDPATIVIWADGTKTVVKCQEGDVYSKETGLALCIAKKALGNTGSFNDIFHKWIPEEEEVEFDISKIESPAQKAFDEAVAKINACMKSTVNKTYRAHVGDAHE